MSRKSLPFGNWEAANDFAQTLSVPYTIFCPVNVEGVWVRWEDET